MEESNWVNYLSAIGSIATPVIVLVLTAVGWKYRQSIERKIRLEEKLREDRIDIYNRILEPFIILLMSETAWQTNPKNKNKDKDTMAVNIMLSLEYRQLSFKLSLIGSDSVVLGFNNLFQYSYSLADNQHNNPKELMLLLGKFLLEIRRSMGNEFTKLDEWSMLEWFITDARKIKEQYS